MTKHSNLGAKEDVHISTTTKQKEKLKQTNQEKKN